MAPPVPLARLFAMALRSLVDDLHDRLEQRGWHDVRPNFGFVLLALRDGPSTVVELAGHLGVTKQAASKLVTSMEDAGYVRRAVGGAGDDGRSKRICLTPRGVLLLDAVDEIHTELEAGWAEVLAPGAVDAMRDDLVRALTTTHGGTLPAVRPTW